MAAKKTQAGYELLVRELTKDPNAVYADLKAKADKEGHSVFPVMYGRAKAQLGLVKSAKWGQSKKTSARQANDKHSRGSKSDRVRELLGSGMTSSEIAKKVGCSVNLVYAVSGRTVASNTRGKRGPGRPRKVGRRGPGRPPKSADPLASLQTMLVGMKENQRERERLVETLEKVRELIDQAL